MTQFNSESFVEAVSNSNFISDLPAEESENIKWLLFNAPEELQKQFFEIFLKESEISGKIFSEALKAAKSFLEQYNNENKSLYSKLLGKVNKLNEARSQKQDQSGGESLLKSL